MRYCNQVDTKRKNNVASTSIATSHRPQELEVRSLYHFYSPKTKRPQCHYVSWSLYHFYILKIKRSQCHSLKIRKKYNVISNRVLLILRLWKAHNVISNDIVSFWFWGYKIISDIRTELQAPLHRRKFTTLLRRYLLNGNQRRKIPYASDGNLLHKRPDSPKHSQLTYIQSMDQTKSKHVAW